MKNTFMQLNLLISGVPNMVSQIRESELEI